MAPGAHPRQRWRTRPVLFTEKLPAVGTVGDLILADFSQYKIGLRQDMSLDRFAHAGFTTDTTYYRGILRADGQGKWSSPYTPAAGRRAQLVRRAGHQVVIAGVGAS